MKLVFERRFSAPPSPTSYVVLPHAGGVLLLPSMRGTPLGSAFWSANGEAFVDAPVDGSGIDLGAEPVVDLVNSHHWRQIVHAGRAFFRFGGRMVELTVGPSPRFAPSAYAPPPSPFSLQDLALDASGTWWAAGHSSRDSLIGMVFTSPDGASWRPVPAKLEGSVFRLLPHERGMRALHYKHVTELTAEGATKLFSMKAHLYEALFSAERAVTVGEGIVSVLAAKAKRAKYVASPVPANTPTALLAVEGALLMGAHTGLFASEDGLAWEKVDFAEPVMALASTASGPLVVTARADVLHVRRA